MPQPLEIPFPAAVWVEHLEDDGARIPASKRPVQRGAPVLMERLGGRVLLVGRRAHRVTEGLSARRALSIVNGRLRLRRDPKGCPPTRRSARMVDEEAPPAGACGSLAVRTRGSSARVQEWPRPRDPKIHKRRRPAV